MHSDRAKNSAKHTGVWFGNNRYSHVCTFAIVSQQPLKFRFSGKLARLLGRESVSSDTAALFELVKNGYDADAPKVTVTFESRVSNDGKNARIIVEDAGYGMSYDDIVNKWMVVGTNFKERETTTKGGRTVVGNKGVGRFATEKLARRVTVISRPQKTSEEIRLEIDWTKFEDENVQFDDVEIPISINSNRAEPDKHGLKIILEDLRERWGERKIQLLEASIGSIVLPDELQPSGQNFTAEIRASDFAQQVSTRVESLLFKKAPYSISAILPDKESRTTVQIKREGKLVESKRVDCEGKEIPGGNRWQPFGGCEVQIYVYPHRTKYNDWDSYYRLLKLSYVGKIVRQNCGLKIYRDGFWVSPYGGPGNDWMELDAARVQSNLRVGNTQIIGFVMISKKKNKEIRDTTTRERLEENAALHSLKYFIKCVCDEFFEFRKQEVKEKNEQKPRVRGEAIISELNNLTEEILSSHKINAETKTNVEKSAKQLKKMIVTYRKQSASDYTELEAQQRMYRSLAALGISSAASYHEIFNVITSMGLTPKVLRIKLADNHVNDESLAAFVDDLDQEIRTIAQYVWFVRRFVQGIGSAVEQQKKEKVHLKNKIESLWDEFAGLSNTDVTLIVKSYPDDLSAVMNLADFFSIVLNIFTNSLKALEDQTHSKKKIQVTVDRTSTHLEMRFSDNGIGISEDIRDKIFRPLYSNYEDGTGMGLTIVSEVLSNYGGEIECLSNSELGCGATFLVRIPWGRIKDE